MWLSDVDCDENHVLLCTVMDVIYRSNKNVFLTKYVSLCYLKIHFSFKLSASFLIYSFHFTNFCSNFLSYYRVVLVSLAKGLHILKELDPLIHLLDN